MFVSALIIASITIGSIVLAILFIGYRPTSNWLFCHILGWHLPIGYVMYPKGMITRCRFCGKLVQKQENHWVLYNGEITERKVEENVSDFW